MALIKMQFNASVLERKGWGGGEGGIEGGRRGGQIWIGGRGGGKGRGSQKTVLFRLYLDYYMEYV